ncbi:MAG: hypothetical protein JXA37_03970 [Chloroflexia bacterium]|nr:hypothetical protein [Chloroflexia bacterium]
MVLEEGCSHFNWTGGGRVVLVLDASESAQPFQSQIVSLAQGVLRALPAQVGCQLYLLGNPRPYPHQELTQRSGPWFRENRGRASLLAPLREGLEAEELSTIVLIGAGPVFDLPDWAGSDLLQRLLLASVGPSLQGRQDIAEELRDPRVSDLMPRLYNPLTRVEIAGPGFMPLYWDNDAYGLQWSAGQVSLRAAQAEEYRLALSFLAAPGALLRARVQRAAGEALEMRLPRSDELQVSSSGGGLLGPAEQDVFERAVRGQPFRCPHCGQEHSADTLFCLESGSLLGEPIYPSLQESGLKGFVLLQAADAGVRFSPYPGRVLRLAEGEVALPQGPRAQRYRYDPSSERWQPTGLFLKPYARLGRHCYVVLC